MEALCSFSKDKAAHPRNVEGCRWPLHDLHDLQGDMRVNFEQCAHRGRRHTFEVVIKYRDGDMGDVRLSEMADKCFKWSLTIDSIKYTCDNEQYVAFDEQNPAS